MTLPAHVPQEFKEALVGFARSLKRNFSVPIEANPEDQLKAPTQVLLRAAAATVQPRTEAQVEGLGARPDIGVAVRNLLCGYVELKAPSKGARTGRFTGADRKQWEKFRVLPNLLYTDGSEWALYRSGEPQGAPVLFSGDVTTDGARAFNDRQIAELHTLLIDFLSWQPIAPNSALALAKTLAPLCRLLREDVFVAVRNPDSGLAQLAREWRQYLFPDADDGQFADAYAQTLTYALLLARLSGEEHLTTNTAADVLDSGHGLLAQALRILSQPQARNEIAVPVDLLERMIRAVDPARLHQRGAGKADLGPGPRCWVRRVIQIAMGTRAAVPYLSAHAFDICRDQLRKSRLPEVVKQSYNMNGQSGVARSHVVIFSAGRSRPLL